MTAAALTAEAMRPSGPGGEHITSAGTPAARAGAAHGPAHLPDDNAVSLMASVGMELGPVVSGDVVVGNLERFSQRGGNLVEGSSHVRVRDPQLVNADAVEPFRQVPHGLIAAGPDLREYAAHAVDRHGVVHDVGGR
jgi:hypothetical protein